MAISTLSASEVRANARQYTKDLPVQLKEGTEIWGRASGGVPHHREWWILDGNKVLGHLDQGSYENSHAAKKQRMVWALQLGVVESVLESIAPFTYEWIPVGESSWKRYLL